MSIFQFETLPEKPMFKWNEKTANEFSRRIIQGQELTVTFEKSIYKGSVFLNMFKPDQVEVSKHWFEMALFVGFITCDSGGEIGRHYIFNSPS